MKTLLKAMHYPHATAGQVDRFHRHGFLVVHDAIPAADLDELERHCDTLIEQKETLANDWAWDANESRENRSFRIVQSSPAKVWKDIAIQPYRRWLVAFSSTLMRMDLEFWYDQFLGKPPGKHSKTPHMSMANTGTAWRKAVTNHLQAVGAGGEGGHYPWRVKVDQRTGERVVAAAREQDEGPGIR